MIDTSSVTPPFVFGPVASLTAHRATIDAALQRVLNSGHFILGAEVTAFEQEFAAYLGVRAAVGVASGTDALHLALRTLGVGPGDGVFTVAHTAVAVVAAIELTGAVPLLVDVDPSTYVMDANSLESAIQRARHSLPSIRLKAVVPVHLYGQPADMPALLEIARRHDLFVVEDGSQAHGAELAQRKVGTWGDVAVFSFYPTKNLGALGDGGAIVTQSTTWAEELRLGREFGWRQRYVSDRPGMNSRLDELQAAILRVKLLALDAENQRRRWLAERYTMGLADCGLILPQVCPGSQHVYHQYVIQTPNRAALQTTLSTRQIPTQIHYPWAVHEQPAYRDRLPRLVPLHPHLTEEHTDRVVQTVREWAAHGAS